MLQVITLMYLIYPGQYYVAYEQEIPNIIYVFDPFNTSHWQAVYYDDPTADNYYRISLNSRWAYVKVKDVILIEDLSNNHDSSNSVSNQGGITLTRIQLIIIISCSIVGGTILTLIIACIIRRRQKAKNELNINLNYIASASPPPTTNGAVVTV
jgi:sensor c-di-GMP phosphodiesterase-like protein